MAKAIKKPKEQPAPLTDKDNPSLCEVGGVIHLRVFEDFYVERELPKWKKFDEDWKALKKRLNVSDDWAVSNMLDRLKRGEPLPFEVEHKKDKNGSAAEEILVPNITKEELEKALKEHIEGKKKIDDDKWHIQEKHEREVAAALEKFGGRIIAVPTFWDKLKNKFKKDAPTLKPVEIAFSDLKNAILHTSTEALTKQTEILTAAERVMREAGQYAKADLVKEYRGMLAYEKVLVDAGFTDYLEEDQLIEFIRKSERGTMIEFLRYYEGMIPKDVMEKKKAADKLMIFDNYVIAHYTDFQKKAEKVEKKEVAKTVKRERAKRRDPILFGMIKESRKLFFIADWVDETDDLTMDVIEKALGKSRKHLGGDDPVRSSFDTAGGSLSNVNASTITYNQVTSDEYDSSLTQADRVVNMVARYVYRNADDGSTYSPDTYFTPTRM